MKKLLCVVALCFGLAAPAGAANFFVRSSASSSGDGSDWDHAWKDTSAINWGALSPGDTVYFAGGNYGQLKPQKAGANGKPIVFERARASDASAAGAPGWQPGFDSTVTFNAPSGSTAIYLYDKKDWLTFDGRIWGGIVAKYGNGGQGSGCELDGPASQHVTFAYIKALGPGKTTQSGACRGFNLTPSATGTGGGGMDHVTMSYCETSAPGDSSVYVASAGGADDFLMEYCAIHDAAAINAATWHPNEIYCGTVTNSVFRFNKVYNIGVEGLFFNDPNNANIRIYGNLFYWGTSTDTGARGLEFNKSGNAGVLVYQNTFCDLPIGIQIGKADASFSGCEFKNNICWNTSLNTKSGWSSDYNYFSYARSSEAHSIQNGPDPFIDKSSFDYHLKSGASARGAGAPLGPPYDVDMEGRSQPNPPDMGAYASGSAPAPTPTPTPAPTPTPSPVPTPTPQPTPTPPAPTPTPTPAGASYRQWLDRQADWIRQNPPTPDR